MSRAGEKEIWTLIDLRNERLLLSSQKALAKCAGLAEQMDAKNCALMMLGDPDSLCRPPEDAAKLCVENGLWDAKKRCVSCHDKENDPDFDFKKAYEKIKHLVPEEKKAANAAKKQK